LALRPYHGIRKACDIGKEIVSLNVSRVCGGNNWNDGKEWLITNGLGRHSTALIPAVLVPK